jgi:hypothetical protein
VTARQASCPSCGANVEFLWSSAVQTTCPFCRSILVRHDVDLAKVGVVGDLPPDSSPIQRGTEGRWRGRAFTVVGRIVYEHDRGAWNEWHLRFADADESGWLSDAQLEYAVSRLSAFEGPALDEKRPRVGQTIRLGGGTLAVSALTRARYRGVEGELPFEYWDKRDVLFADLRGPTGAFAPVDYSESPPLLFAGEFVRFADLGLRNLRAFEGWPTPA